VEPLLRGKATSITYSECVCVCVSVALVIQHAKCMRRIILSSVACPVEQNFSTLSHKCHNYQGRKLLNIKRVFWHFLQLLSTKFIVLRIQRDTNTNVHTSSCRVPFILVSFNESLIFSINFWKITKHQISWKIFQWEPSCSMRTDERMDRQTDMMKLIVAFRNVAKAPNTGKTAFCKPCRGARGRDDKFKM